MPSKMHSNSRPFFGSLAVKTLSAAIASAALFSNAYAAGLGKLTVLSSLGQPLRAEIELTSISPDEQGALVAKLASTEAFTQANIDFNPALLSLRFALDKRGQRQFIRVTSVQPLNEPFVDLLLELAGPKGRLIREYTFLLDPAELRTSQPAQVAPVAVLPEPVPSEEPSGAVRESAPARDDAAVSQRPVEVDAAANDYLVHKGDSLSKIARQFKADGVSLDQMLVALYQANPDAFIDKNMNRLKAGHILSVPSANAAGDVDRGEARRMIVAQAADFNAYRNKLAGQVAASAAQPSDESRQTAGGKITAEIKEHAAPTSESKDRLTLSSANGTASANGDVATGISEEDLIAKDKALVDANTRIQELEKNISDLQQILEIRNQELAEQQNRAESVNTESPSAAVEADKEQAKPVPAPESKPKPKPKPKPVKVAPPPESSVVDDLLENPFTLPGIGALLLVALGGFGLYRARKQKQTRQFEDSIITDSSLKANSLFGSTGGQSVDTNNSVFNSSFASAASQLDTNEVDPVAEADVYIAYGRDAQAEEILKEALRTQPERHAVRLKLLEIYSNRKDLRAFEVLATELYGLTKGQGEEWLQAAEMGIALDPNNPLYADGKTAENGNVSSGNLAAPTQPLDDQGLATLLSTTQSDASQMDGADALETGTSYFSNTEAEGEKPLEPGLAPAAESAKPDEVSNEMDFNLDGMNLSDDMLVPNTIPRPETPEPPQELASIDFDFLAQPKMATEPAVDEEKPAEPGGEGPPDVLSPVMEFTLDDTPAEPARQEEVSLDIDMPADGLPPLEMEAPSLESSQDPVETTQEPEPNPMDFDLSGISLELNPNDPAASMPELSMDGLEGDALSTNAEMATKLDLAIAYQEIGDKEGARELLDEVVKGGNPIQVEKAKSLLLELA